MAGAIELRRQCANIAIALEPEPESTSLRWLGAREISGMNYILSTMPFVSFLPVRLAHF
jgi:hypothetical protein